MHTTLRMLEMEQPLPARESDDKSDTDMPDFEQPLPARNDDGAGDPIRAAQLKQRKQRNQVKTDLLGLIKRVTKQGRKPTHWHKIRILRLTKELEKLEEKCAQEMIKPQSSPILKVDRDCLFLIFDTIIDQEKTISLAAGVKNPVLGFVTSLSQTCREFRKEAQSWSQKRGDLVNSSVFGLYNPFLTSFEFSFTNLCSWENQHTRDHHSIIRRLYCPEAATKHVILLNNWQRGINWIHAMAPWPTKVGQRALDCRAYGSSMLKLATDIRLGSIEGGVPVMIDQHEKDGVRDVLVLDPSSYGNLVDVQHKLSSWRRITFGFGEGERAVCWTRDYKNYFKHRQIFGIEERNGKVYPANGRNRTATAKIGG